MATTQVDEDESVCQHRLERFRELGFSTRQASILEERGADWHEAKRLLEQRCPLELAYRILR